MDLVEVLQAQPLRSEPLAEHVGPRIGQQPRHLLLEFGRPRQPARFGDPQQFRIRRRGPQEKRQTRGQIDVADRVGLAVARRGRSLLEAEDEARAREDALERHADAFVETAVGDALAIQRHQCVDVALAGGAAERLRGQARDDALRALHLLRRGGRLALEDAAAARRLGHAGRLEGTGDRHVAQVRQRREPVSVGDAGAGDRPLERGDEVLHRAFEAGDEGGRDAMRPGRDGDRLGAQVHAVGVGAVHPPVHVEQRHAFPVHRDLDLLGRLGRVQRGAAVAVERAGGLVVERHAEAVGAVGRERVLHREAATRAERRALDLLTLRGGARNEERHLARGGRLVAHRQAADLGGSGEIRLHHRRRQQLGVGDVVEVRHLGVERQVVAGVHVEAHQVAHRLRVLGAVEALERAAARRGHLRGAGIGGGFERGGQAIERRVGGTTSAGRRHLPGAHLADHLLGDIERIGRSCDLVALQAEPTGFRAIVVATGARLLHHGLWCRDTRRGALRGGDRRLRMRGQRTGRRAHRRAGGRRIGRGRRDYAGSQQRQGGEHEPHHHHAQRR